jgi:hypothetical protein
VTDLTDEEFFKIHPDRQTRIRLPSGPQPVRDQQRAMRMLTEGELQFRSLGPHDKSRRRMLVWKTPVDHPTHPNHLLQIPFLLHSDESVEDRDDVLLPILKEIMMGAATQ